MWHCNKSSGDNLFSCDIVTSRRATTCFPVTLQQVVGRRLFFLWHCNKLLPECLLKNITCWTPCHASFSFLAYAYHSKHATIFFYGCISKNSLRNPSPPGTNNSTSSVNPDCSMKLPEPNPPILQAKRQKKYSNTSSVCFPPSSFTCRFLSQLKLLFSIKHTDKVQKSDYQWQRLPWYLQGPPQKATPPPNLKQTKLTNYSSFAIDVEASKPHSPITTPNPEVRWLSFGKPIK